MKPDTKDFCRNCKRDRSFHKDDRCPIRDERDGTVYSTWMRFRNNVTADDWYEEVMESDPVFGNIAESDVKQHTDPDHYIQGRKIQPWDAIADWKLDFALGNVVKYVARSGRKGGIKKAIDDLTKAKNYLDFKIRELQKESF